MPEITKYRIQLKRPTLGPNQKTTAVDRQALIKTIVSIGIDKVMKIRFANLGMQSGTDQLDGGEMLRLWKDVEGARKLLSK
ncbi:MAG: hypothetical protein ABIR24_04695 [Verrucomicrobiota bacterium]